MAARKLTDEQIISIYRDERKIRLIAAEYHVSESHVSHIKTGRAGAKVTARLAKTRGLEARIAEVIVRHLTGPASIRLIAKEVLRLAETQVKKKLSEMMKEEKDGG